MAYTVTRTTAEDIAELNATMRDEDRAEMVVFGKDYEDFATCDASFAVRINGDLVCVIGLSSVFNTQTHLSNFRHFALLSTQAVEKHKYDYVRISNLVFRQVANTLPRWVTTVFSLPLADYTKSIKWQERILGFSRIGEVMINGKKHAILMRKKGV